MSPTASRREVLASVGGTAALAGLAGCSAGVFEGQSSTPDLTKVTVGSKNFVENRILGAMIYERLLAVEAVQPVHAIGFGSSEDTWQALLDGKIDTYWDYTGTIWHAYRPQRTERIDDPARLYERVRRDLGRNDLGAAERATFDNPFVFVTTSEWADRVGVHSISDLVRHVNAGNTDVGIAVGATFFDRPDGWPGLVDWYGVEDPTRREWETNLEIVDLVLAYDFLSRGDVEVVMGYATDAHISHYGFEVLADDRDFFPIYNPVPLFRAETADRVPDLPRLINPLGPVIGSVEAMRSLNTRVAFGGETPREVARDALEREGVLE